MKEVLLWLLVSLPNEYTSYTGPKHVHVVERFVTVEECQRVSVVLREFKPGGGLLNLRCVQARVPAGVGQ